MAVKGDFQSELSIQWIPLIDPAQVRRTWGDPEVATEHGAYALAALLVVVLTPWTIVERSRKGTGFDYWLGPKGSPGELFQGKARLEVSGIRSGSLRDVERRVGQKRQQVNRSARSGVPAVVAVVEFGVPGSHVVNA
jgi:hypothetical protein